MRTFRNPVVRAPPSDAKAPRWPGSPCYRGFTITRKTRHTSRQECSGWVISLAQRPLPDKTPHTLERDIHTPAGLELAVPTSKRRQTRALERAAVEIVSTVWNCHQTGHQASDLSLALCAAMFRSKVQTYKLFSSQQMSMVKEKE
jgi:hypothetical protein